MSEQAEIQRTIEKALAKRNKARAKKMWSVADDIRNMLKEMGVLIQDTGPNTSEWRWAKGALEDSEAEDDGSDDSDSAEAPARPRRRRRSARPRLMTRRRRRRSGRPSRAASSRPSSRQAQVRRPRTARR